MIRQIIKIDEEKCNGCKLCVKACHEGAIEIINGKAKLIKDDYCDGLGNCLPVCPTGAITFENREALPYDREAQEKYLESKKHSHNNGGGCPGAKLHNIEQQTSNSVNGSELYSLSNWPLQIKLMPVNAPYLQNANLLIAADCTAFAYPNFSTLVKNKVVAISCPKLDSSDTEKLALIFQNNNIKNITIVRMSVPCCGAIVHQVNEAIKSSEKNIDVSIIIISPDGNVIKQ